MTAPPTTVAGKTVVKTPLSSSLNVLSSQIYLKDTFNQAGALSREDWFHVQGGSVTDGCAFLSDGLSLTFNGIGQRQLVTVDLDLRNARFTKASLFYLNN